MSLFNYLPINAFRLIYLFLCPSFVVKKLESIFIFVTMNLAVFSSVTRSCGKDILSILVRNNKKCLPKLLFISLIRIQASPLTPRRERRSTNWVRSSRRGATRDGCIRRLDYQPLFGKCTRASLPYRLLIRQIQKSPNNERFETLASIIANLHNLSSSVKLKQKLR